MEWFLAGLATALGAGSACIVILRRHAAREQQRRLDAHQLAGVRAMADEDTTLLGEQLQRLGDDHAVSAMDSATRTDYQTALDAYEAAKLAVPRLTSGNEVSSVVDILSTGRYALACVQARLQGLPVPELRVPCFFNPQHGPSAKDVVWTAPGKGTRTVPACTQDAARVANGETPPVRTISFGTSDTPVWDAGSAYLPYGENYFSTAVTEAGFRRQSQGSGLSRRS